MSEELHEKISQFLDNELDCKNSLHLLHNMLMRADLQNKLKRYQMIGHALKEQGFIPVTAGFSEQVWQKIETYHSIETMRRIDNWAD